MGWQDAPIVGTEPSSKASVGNAWESAPLVRQNVMPEKSNTFNQSTEDMPYDIMTGLPLFPSNYGQAPTGRTATAAKILTTAAGIPVNYAMGMATIPLNVANMASKLTGIGNSSTQQALEAKNIIEKGINQQSYAPVTQGAALAGEIFNPLTMAIPAALGNVVTKIGAAAPALTKYAAPIAESLTSGGFKTGLVPKNALDKLVNTAVRAIGGGTVGAVTNKLLTPEESTTTAGAISAAVPIVIPPIAKGLATVGGKLVDLATGQAAKVEAGNIARKMAGDTLNQIRAANGVAPLDIDAAQAAYGIQNDVWQAFLDVVKGKDTKAVFSTLKSQQAKDQLNELARLAGGATETEALANIANSKQVLNKLTTPIRESALGKVDETGRVIPALTKEATQLRQTAADKVADVRRFAGAQARAIDPVQDNLATDYLLGKLANSADEVAGKAAFESLTAGTGARTAEAKLAELQQAGIKPIYSTDIAANIENLANQPGVRADDIQRTALLKLRDKFIDLGSPSNGVMIGEDINQIRKTSINDAINKALSEAGYDPKAQSQRLAGLLGDVRGYIDDAIRGAGGGKDWDAYLSTFSKGRQQLDQKVAAGQLAKILEKDPQKFIDIVRGKDPDFVEKIFGAGNKDIMQAMGGQRPKSPMLKLFNLADDVERDIKIEEQINNARRALGFKEGSWAEKIPGFVGLKTAVAKKLIQTIEGKINTKAMEVLVKGAESGKNMNEILNTLPASERQKLLIILNSSEEWSPLLGAAAERKATKNKLAPQQQNQNALAR
jgi:hypothetical protein